MCLAHVFHIGNTKEIITSTVAIPFEKEQLVWQLLRVSWALFVVLYNNF